jgi:hypothetical protein
VELHDTVLGRHGRDPFLALGLPVRHGRVDDGGRKSWLLVRHWAVRVRRAGKAFYL